MVVKIRFAPESLRERRRERVDRIHRRNGRAARLGAIVLTLVTICLSSFGAWRFVQDLGWADDFIISDGLFSHWQVWIALAVLTQWAAWRLASYARVEDPESEFTESLT